MTKEEYFKEWLRIIDPKELNKIVTKVNELYRRKPCEPDYKDIFKVFNVTPYDKLKVVMLSQDPYPQKGISTGIAFGNKKGTINLSPSLNILKEAAINFELPHNCCTFDETLEEWCNQGVLMLNTALTVETNRPGTHSDLWRSFIIAFLNQLSEVNPGLIYVLWGERAKSFSQYIEKNNIVYKMPHPAYYARIGQKIPTTFFPELNKKIKYEFDATINWFNEIKL